MLRNQPSYRSGVSQPLCRQALAPVAVASIPKVSAIPVYTGSHAAFKFSIKRELERERQERVEECNRAMLGLMRQFNWLLNYQHQFLKPHRTNEARHLFLLPSQPLEFKAWTVNVPALAFLLQTDATELPFMLGLEDQRFHGAIAAINARSVVHQEFQRTLATSSLDATKEQPLNAIEHAVGQRMTVTLAHATDQIYELVDAVILSMAATGRNAKNVLNSIYPDAKIIGFSPPESVCKQ